MNTFDAILIDSSRQNNQRQAGRLIIEDFQIRFVSDDQTLSFPLNGLKITIGGAGNRLIFFNYDKKSEVSIYTSDHSILKHPTLKQHPELLPQVKKVKSRKRMLTISFLSFVSVILGILVSLFLMKDYFVRKLAEQAPVEWEQKIGDKLFQGLSIQYTFIKNDSLEQVFLEEAKPLIKQIEKDGVKIDIYFTKDPTINAFALPGGKVIIQSGLIENAKSWEEVFGVLGHELAHVTQRHHLRGVINNLGLYAIISAFFGDISAIAGTVANTGGELASLANSRGFETEADEVGMHYLVKAKVNTNGFISFFETLKKEHKNPLEKELSFLSTHPATDDRIQDLKQLQKKIPHYQPITFNHSFKSFQKSFNQ